MENEEISLDLGAELGAIPSRSQKFSVYIPSRTKEGKPINQRLWVEDALVLLAEIGGGATATPLFEGIWIESQSGKVLHDSVIIVYCFIDVEKMIDKIANLRDFLYRMGRDNSQDAIAFEFDGIFFIVENKVFSKE